MPNLTTPDRSPPTQDAPHPPPPAADPPPRDRHMMAVAEMDPEQHIRTEAGHIATALLGDCAGIPAGVAARLVELAEPIADWIRTGARPDELPACACRPDPEQPNTWDGTECPRHNPAVRERRRP